MEVEKHLQEWIKSSPPKGKRDFKKKEIDCVDGEWTFTITDSIIVKGQKVNHSLSFNTYVQNGNDHDTVNLNGDLYRAKQMTDAFDREFQDKIDEALKLE